MQFLPEKHNGRTIVMGKPDKKVIPGGSAKGMKEIYKNRPEAKNIYLHIGTCKVVADTILPLSVGRLVWKREPLGWLVDYGDFYGSHDILDGEVAPSLTHISEKYS